MLPLQNLLRRKVRTLFALLGIAIGISAVVSIVSMAKGLRTQFYRIADQFAWDMIVQQKGVPQPIISHVSSQDRANIVRLPGVKAASLVSLYLTRFADERKTIPLLILGLEPGGEILARYEIVRGRALRRDDEKAIILGELSSKQMGLDVGSFLETQDAVGKYEVVGIFRPPVSGVDLLSGQGIANAAFLERELDVTPSLIIAHLRTGDAARKGEVLDRKQVDEAVAAVTSAMAEQRALRKLEIKPMKSYVDSFKQAEIVDKFAWAMSCLAALVGGIGIANTMLMSVFERTREIGLLRAVGWSRARICSLVVAEGAILSLVGGALGIPLGLLEVLLATRVVEMGWIQVTVEPAVASQAIGLALAIGVLGSLYPGLRAASLEPTEALRYE